MNEHVRRQGNTIQKSGPANLTRLHLLLSIKMLIDHMTSEIIPDVEALLTDIALEALRVLVLVCHVYAQMQLRAHALAADATLVRRGVVCQLMTLHVPAQTSDTLEHFAAVWTLVRRCAVHEAEMGAERDARLAGEHAASALTNILELRRMRFHVLVQGRYRAHAPPTHRTEEAALVLRRYMRAQLLGCCELGGAFGACALLGTVHAPHVSLHGGFIIEIGRATWFGAGNSRSRDGVPPDVYLKSFTRSEHLSALRAGEARIRMAPFVVL